MSTEEGFIDVSLNQDGGIMKKILVEAPEGALGPPPKAAEVIAHYTGTLAEDGSKFDSSVDRGKPFTFKIGMGQVIAGWDQGFATMKVGEKAVLLIKSEYGYGERGSPPKIPGGATLQFEVELLDFKEKQLEKWEMSTEQRLEKAQKMKAEGTEFFKASNFQKAMEKYEAAADFAVGEGISGNQIPENERPLFVSCWSNAAMCYIKLKNWPDATRACNNVLEIDSEIETNIKVLFRRGTARMKLGSLKEAKEDLMAAHKIDKTNKDVRKALNELKVAFQKNKTKEKAAFGGMFNKMDIYNDKQGVVVPNAKGDNPQVFFQVTGRRRSWKDCYADLQGCHT